MIHDELVRYLIQLGGSNTRLDSLSHFGISLTKQDVACPHEFYFFVSLEKNHLSNELVGHSTGATFDAHAGLEESVIVAHQEMTLDLLQSIQNNTHHNQQGRTAEELREAHRHTEQASERRQDSDEGEQDRTRQGDAAHNGVNILSRLLTRFHTRNESVVQLQVLCHLNRIDDDRGVEIGVKAEASEALKPTIAIGINMIACAKMIGITFAAFTLRGIY